MMTPDMLQAIAVIATFSLACVVLCPVLCWVLAFNPKQA